MNDIETHHKEFRKRVDTCYNRIVKEEKLREFARTSLIELEMIQMKHEDEIACFHAVREKWFKEIQCA